MASQVQPNMPLKALASALNNNILVKLKDGSEIIGILEQSDTSMNLVLSEAKEIDEKDGKLLANYGRIFIRGSNILYIAVNVSDVTFNESE